MTLQDHAQALYPQDWMGLNDKLIAIAEDVQRLTPLNESRAFEVAKTVEPYGVQHVTDSPEFGLLPLAIYCDVLNYVFAWRAAQDARQAALAVAGVAQDARQAALAVADAEQERTDGR